MEEKKLTDEQIINALKVVKKETLAFEYDKEKRRFEYVTGKEILDLIHRQKAEIERLTEERNKYKGLYETMYRKCSDLQDKEFNCEELRKVKNEYFDKAAELQKQVDDLKQENSILSLTVEMHDGVEHESVKDTAKEIYNEINSCIEQGQEYCGLDWRGLLTAKTVILVWCKKHGVEVE